LEEILKRPAAGQVKAYGAPSIQEQAAALRIDGYNVNAQSLPLGQAEKETGSNPALQAGN